MCGRFTLRTRLNQLLQTYGIDESPFPAEPRYNIAPSQPVSVIRADSTGDRPQLATLRWGLVPSWAEDVRIGNQLINARAETVATKPAFRHALRFRRCLIPADGFYEWEKSGKRKQPYFIHMADGRPFVFAGLWDRWEKIAPAVESCAIITTPSNCLVARLHDRMPAILTDAAAAVWLDTTITDPDRLTPLLAPFPSEAMVAYPVSPAVNSPKHDAACAAVPLTAPAGASTLEAAKFCDVNTPEVGLPGGVLAIRAAAGRRDPDCGGAATPGRRRGQRG